MLCDRAIFTFSQNFVIGGKSISTVSDRGRSELGVKLSFRAEGIGLETSLILPPSPT